MLRGLDPSPVAADRQSKKRFFVSLVIVLGLHLCVLWWVKSSPKAPPKRQATELVIELGQAPPVGAAGQESPEPPSPRVKPPETRTAPTMRRAEPPTPAAAKPAPREAPRPDAPPALPTAGASPASNDSPQASPTAPEPPAPLQAIPPAQRSVAGSSESVRTAEPDYKAAYLNNSRPPYPRNAHRFGIEGTVILQAEVNEEGVPLQVRVFQTSGNDLLDEAALTTVAKWRFSPARKDGVMVRALVKIPITFSLKSSAAR